MAEKEDVVCVTFWGGRKILMTYDYFLDFLKTDESDHIMMMERV